MNGYKFYRDYGDARCFGTNLTFKEIRKKFFRTARSRTRFFAFRTVARILSGKLQAVIDNPKADVHRLLIDAMRTIDSDFTVE